MKLYLIHIDHFSSNMPKYIESVVYFSYIKYSVMPIAPFCFEKVAGDFAILFVSDIVIASCCSTFILLHVVV